MTEPPSGLDALRIDRLENGEPAPRKRRAIGWLPARQAMRLQIAEALRRV